MSAIPPKADIRPLDQDVCFGPKADILDPLNRVDAIRPPDVALQVLADVGVLEVARARVDVDQAAGHGLLDDLLEAAHRIVESD